MMEDILPGNDCDLKQPVIDMLKSFNVDFLTGEEVIKLSETDDNSIIALQSGKKLTAEKCLVCISRVPNIPRGAGDIGIEYDEMGIVVDENFITGVPNIYAVGDVNGRCLMGSVAINQGISAALHILGKRVPIQYSSYEGLPRAIFTIPEIAGRSSGMGAREQGIKYKSQNINLPKLGEEYPRVTRMVSDKVLVDGNDKLQGIWMVGKNAA